MGPLTVALLVRLPFAKNPSDVVLPLLLYRLVRAMCDHLLAWNVGSESVNVLASPNRTSASSSDWAALVSVKKSSAAGADWFGRFMVRKLWPLSTLTHTSIVKVKFSYSPRMAAKLSAPSK
jgi:hypothetical protein